MPLYEYECRSCGKRIEILQRFDDPAPESCECGETGTLKKLVSAPAFQFKGDGWYVTDYARKSAEGNGKGDKADKSDSKGDGAQEKSAADKGASGTSSEKSPPEKPPRGMTKPEAIQQKSPPGKGAKST